MGGKIGNKILKHEVIIFVFSHASSMMGGIPKISIGMAKFISNVIKKSTPQGVEKLNKIEQQMAAYFHCHVSVK